jgi:peroxiredoxin Q/BCP
MGGMASTRPEPGTPAPLFSLQDQHGQTVRLEDLRGRWVVLYFYPKDDTPGCTKEACSFRDAMPNLDGLNAVVLGVSGDDAESHTAFASKHNLPFQLLVDSDHAVARVYGAWGMKNLYGRKFEGILRSTFLIDPEGSIAKVWARVSTATHGDDVAAWLHDHQAA